MKWTEGIDKLGLGLYFMLCIFAIANIYSVDESLGKKQLIFFGISLFVGLIIFFSRSKFFENMSGIIYIGGVLLLIGLFPFGKEILGQKNWYKFGSFTMQPVEFAKIGVALMLANYVSGSEFNLKNRTKNKTKFKGVEKVANKFRSRLWNGTNFISLGYHDTAEEAHTAYLKAKREHNEINS